MIYISSDLHFSHFNIIKYCNRPFKSIGEMNDVLIKNINSVVGPNDIFYHLGDFCFGDKYDYIAHLVSRINGKKIFIRGNHDKIKILDRLKEDNLIDSWHDVLGVSINGQYIWMSHYPHLSWDGSARGSWHCFAHVHGRLNGKETGLSMDVGCDTHNFYPWSFEQVSVKMAELKQKMDAEKLVVI